MSQAVQTQEKEKQVKDAGAATGITEEQWRLTPEQKEMAIKAITSIAKGPRVMRTYMEMCMRCGTCAEQCPIYFGSREEKYNPVVRSDKIRDIYKKYCTTSGKIFGGLVGAKDFEEGELEQWVESFYACTGCRRCATFCPMGIDNSVITRKGRAILDKLGMTPPLMLKVIQASLETRQDTRRRGRRRVFLCPARR
jgi:Fe-S oxidoreductase